MSDHVPITRVFFIRASLSYSLVKRLVWWDMIFHTLYMIRIEFQFNSGPTHVNVGPIFHSNERLIIGNMRKPNSIKIEFVPPLTPHSWFHRTVPMSEVSMWQELSKKKTKESSSCHVETLTMERFLGLMIVSVKKGELYSSLKFTASYTHSH